jgi:hypothetical protein
MNSVFHSSSVRRLTGRGAGGEGVVSLRFAVFNRDWCHWRRRDVAARGHSRQPTGIHPTNPTKRIRVSVAFGRSSAARLLALHQSEQRAPVRRQQAVPQSGKKRQPVN